MALMASKELVEAQRLKKVVNEKVGK